MLEGLGGPEPRRWESKGNTEREGPDLPLSSTRSGLHDWPEGQAEVYVEIQEVQPSSDFHNSHGQTYLHTQVNVAKM